VDFNEKTAPDEKACYLNMSEENTPLYVAIVWHMHQPYYKDLASGEYKMPWVRLHGLKDYLDMALLLEEFPAVHVTFNLVPSLLEQLEDYVEHGAEDAYLRLSRKPADALTTEDKITLLTGFFNANYETMIKAHPRYHELYMTRGWAKSPEELRRVLRYMSTEDLRDLQVWFNLAWIDPYLRQKDSFLTGLVRKGRQYTESEKLELLARQQSVLKQIIPTYRRLQEQGQIEISTTPYYHPILPLIYDTEIARRSSPTSQMPSRRFNNPEDAQAQVEMAAASYTRLFGQPPRGMWPAEGAVSEEIIPLFVNAGITWSATDQNILARSLEDTTLKRDRKGHLDSASMRLLYHPYHYRKDQTRMVILFRDQFLSDLIGFQYAYWKPEDAAQDLIDRLEYIQSALQQDGLSYLVTILLDGENCWEHYQDDGLPFLRHLYGQLSGSKTLRPTTPSLFLKTFTGDYELQRLHPGSWINQNFSIWIGSNEDNKSWDYLGHSRADIQRHIERAGDKLSPEQIERAKKLLYIAEGSDWNWWYGDEHSSGVDEEFDLLYRSHLMNAYAAIGVQAPAFLSVPIKSKGEMGRLLPARAFIMPTLDGRDTNYYEWLLAGRYDPTLGGGSMHQTRLLLRRIYYGFDSRTLYVRIDPDPALLTPQQAAHTTLAVMIFEPRSWRIEIPLRDTTVLCYEQDESDAWVLVQRNIQVAIDELVELAIDLGELNVQPGQRLLLQAVVLRDGQEIERCPLRNPIMAEIPEKDYEERMWIV
jgi:alpha-amylase/alpha-mannosidase (GH57 family)